MEIKPLVKPSIKTLSTFNIKIKTITKKFNTITNNVKFCKSFFHEENHTYESDKLVHKVQDNSEITDGIASIIDLIQNLKTENENPEVQSNTLINEKIFNQLKTELDKHREYLNENQVTQIEKISNNVLDRDTLNKLLSSLLNDLKKKFKAESSEKPASSGVIVRNNRKILEKNANLEFLEKTNVVLKRLFGVFESSNIIDKSSPIAPKTFFIDRIRHINQKFSPYSKKILQFQTQILKKIPENILEFYPPELKSQITKIIKTKKSINTRPRFSTQNLISSRNSEFLKSTAYSTNKLIDFVYLRQKNNLSRDVKNIFQNRTFRTTKLVNLEKKEDVHEEIANEKHVSEKKIESKSSKIKKEISSEKTTTKKTKTSVKKIKKLTSKIEDEQITNRKKVIKTDVERRQKNAKITDYTDSTEYQTVSEKQKIRREKRKKLNTFKAIESKIISISKSQEQRIIDSITKKNVLKASSVFAKNILNKVNFEKFFVKSNLLNNYVTKNKKVIQKNLGLTKIINNENILDTLKKVKLDRFSKAISKKTNFVFLNKFVNNFSEDHKILERINKNKLIESHIKDKKIEQKNRIQNINLLKEAIKINKINKKLFDNYKFKKITGKIFETKKFKSVNENKKINDRIFVDEKFIEKINENNILNRSNRVTNNEILEKDIEKILNINQNKILNNKKIIHDYKIRNFFDEKQTGLTRKLFERKAIDSFRHIDLRKINKEIEKKFEKRENFLITPPALTNAKISRKFINRNIPIDSVVYEPITNRETILNVLRHNKKIKKIITGERENLFKEIGNAGILSSDRRRISTSRKFTHRNLYDDIVNKNVLQKNLIIDTTVTNRHPKTTNMVYKLEKNFPENRETQNVNARQKEKTTYSERVKDSKRDSTQNETKKSYRKPVVQNQQKNLTLKEINDLIDEKLGNLNLDEVTNNAMAMFEDKLRMDRRRVGLV